MANSATTTQAPAGPESAAGAAANMEGIGEENRKVLVWVTELLDPNRRESALMELSKKREQVPELALVIWHSFGEFSHGPCRVDRAYANRHLLDRRHDLVVARNHIRISAAESFPAYRGCLQPSMQRPCTAAVCCVAY